jgi:IclR family acetate operon transcriptional repressor
MLESPLAALTANTLTDWPRLQAALAATRELGVAWDDEEASVGLTCAATVVPSAVLPTHAISVSLPTFRLSVEVRQGLVTMLHAAADSLRGRLSATSAGL